MLLIALLSGLLILWYTYQRGSEKSMMVALKVKAFVQEQTEPDRIYQESPPIDGDSVGENLKALQKQNADLAAWICIPGTQIDYPVMYTPASPQYYLRKDFDKNKSLSGLPFIQETCSITPQSDNVIVYGHNMRDGTMFSGLHLFVNEAFWMEHQTVHFYTTTEKQTYDILAVIETIINTKNAFEYTSFVDADSRRAFDRFITDAKRHAIFDTGIEAVYGDHLLTLSTCSNKGTDSRLVVIARRSDST